MEHSVPSHLDAQAVTQLCPKKKKVQQNIHPTSKEDASQLNPTLKEDARETTYQGNSPKSAISQ